MSLPFHQLLTSGTKEGATLMDNDPLYRTAANRAFFPFLMGHLKLKMGFPFGAIGPDIGLCTGSLVFDSLE